ncbi:2Fe-2S iron-sulfur cluster-binding protein [Prosthecochloris sp.]|jgi:chlorosome envelope protein J|uniref:2Fe-2S iron-sulfur cluster-binding protein n=1 Tax=Prosthecochloris sp. TaxID=290513 RepID=UPI0025DE84D2|nr:2Fe-2S iron-sulfur cluster-binding protein [Prosthecochloris sp.]
MQVYINDKPCQAEVGDRLLDIAQQEKAHIGYLCGGNGICQTCFVYVHEGADCLSSPGKIEQDCISDKLLEKGGRLACQTRIVKEGTVRVISRAEQLRRIALGLNGPELVGFVQDLGYNLVNKLPSGIGNLAGRIQEGKMDPGKSLQNIVKGIGHASLFTVDSFINTFPFMQGPTDFLWNTAKSSYDLASNSLCNISSGALHLPGASCTTCEEPKLEKVQITAGVSKK